MALIVDGAVTPQLAMFANTTTDKRRATSSDAFSVDTTVQMYCNSASPSQRNTGHMSRDVISRHLLSVKENHPAIPGLASSMLPALTIANLDGLAWSNQLIISQFSTSLPLQT